MIALIVGALACAAWAGLLGARGGFWRAAENDDADDAPVGARVDTPVGARVDPPVPAPAPRGPRVIAVVPARNEAEVIGEALLSLLRQRCGGDFSVVVVDDGSDDGTAAVALQAGASACAAGTAGSRVKVIPAPPLPPGWTGKLWAQSQGLAWIRALPEPPDFVLLTDADIAYETGVLESLVRRAERDGLVLSSRMARLPCDSPAERFFIPAFIFFFQMVYPFSRVNDRRWRTAAAAGGCMLVRWRALEAAGGLAAIRREIIDDCALARRLKPLGPIRLVLSRRVKSLRRYSSSRVIREMIMRSAYAQLGFSPALLAGTVLAMGVAFVAPPLLAVAAGGAVAALGAGAWGMMALAFRPTLRFYGRTPWGGVLLPVIALVYLAFTVQSAFLYAQGRGGLWKGRTYNHSSEP